jgi:hypothetical protein
LGSIFVDAAQLALKLRREDLMAMASQKDKELSALDTFDDLVFRRRSLDRRLPPFRSSSLLAPDVTDA